MNVGFVGLGNMGLPMAANILGGGHAVAAYNRTAAKSARLAAMAGARIARSPAEAAAGADVVKAACQHAGHRALVIFVGAEHVEIFQPDALRRQLLAAGAALGDQPVEQVLAPAVEIHWP